MFDETRFTRGYCSPVRLRFGSRFGSMSILAAPCKGINVFDVLPFRKFDSVQINLVRIKLSEDVQTKWDFCIQVKKTNHLSFMCMCIYIYVQTNGNEAIQRHGTIYYVKPTLQCLLLSKRRSLWKLTLFAVASGHCSHVNGIVCR